MVSMVDTVDYMYCVVPSSFDLGTGVTGIEETVVRLVTLGDVAALVNALDGSSYTPEIIGERAGDIEWLKPRAIAHDRVVTWASDRAPTIPMPMWTLFADDSGMLAAMHERYDTLCANLATLRDAREYTVRIFADPAGVASALATLSPLFGELEQSIQDVGPGQAYLLKRKVEEARKKEIRTVVKQVADETYEALARCSVDATCDQLPKEGNAILNASFLVANRGYDDFRLGLTDLMIRYQPAGFKFDFTGPWPAYHFVREH
jgi:hypothetical protein